MLWLALYLPQLPLESALTQHEATRPQALYDTRGLQQTVIACNDAARRQGIQQGMSLSAAHSLCADLLTAEFDPRHVHRALQGLALWAQQFTPVVSLQTPDGLLLEIAASLNLFGGLESLQHAIAASIEQLGYSAVSATAPTPSAAWWLAKVGFAQPLTDVEAVRRTLPRLPLEYLPTDDKKRDALRGMGLKTIGDCLRLPRAGLSKRLGPELLLQLDRALGYLPEPRDHFVVPEQFHSQVMLSDTVQQVQPLLFILQRLLRELCGFLLARGAGTQHLRVGFIKPHEPIETLTLHLLAPSRDADHLFKLWQEKLERHVLTSPVEGLELDVRQLLPLEHKSGDLLQAHKQQKDSFTHFLERLKNRLGDDVICQPVCHASHRPEAASRQPRYPSSADVLNAPVARRPLWLLPQPSALADTNGHPVLHGPLTLLQGPERIESDWWDTQGLRRDYYVAQTPQQQLVWIFQDLKPPSHWFLHGLFG